MTTYNLVKIQGEEQEVRAKVTQETRLKLALNWFPNSRQRLQTHLQSHQEEEDQLPATKAHHTEGPRHGLERDGRSCHLHLRGAFHGPSAWELFHRPVRGEYLVV